MGQRLKARNVQDGRVEGEDKGLGNDGGVVGGAGGGSGDGSFPIKRRRQDAG